MKSLTISWINKLEKKTGSHYHVENENTSKNPPEIILNCDECAFKNKSDGDLKKHIVDNHSLRRDYCDFVGQKSNWLVQFNLQTLNVEYSNIPLE